MCWTYLLLRDHNSSTRYISNVPPGTYWHMWTPGTYWYIKHLLTHVEMTFHLPAALRVEQVSRKGDGSSAGRIPRLPPARLEASSSHKLQTKYREGTLVVKIGIKQKSWHPGFGIKVFKRLQNLEWTNTEWALDGLQRDNWLLLRLQKVSRISKWQNE